MTRVAAAQLQDLQGDPSRALEVILKVISEAEHRKADIICFPECYLQGYTLDKELTAKRAISLESKMFKELLCKLSPHSITAVIGFIEKSGDHFYNTAAVIKGGELLGTYRKTHVFEENFQVGTTYPTFFAAGHIIGVNICYDARFPEGAAVLAGSGAKLLFYPLNNKLPIEKAVLYRDEHITNLIDRAKETGCWVISSDVIAEEDSYTGYGCTAIVAPTGEVKASVEALHTGLIAVDI